MQIRKIVISCLCATLLLTGCSFAATHEIDTTNKQYDTLSKPVHGCVSYGENEASINETGMFYINNMEQLCYYEYDSDDWNILCNNSKCKHRSQACNAYMGDKRIYGGFAYYNDYVYVFYQDDGENKLDLARMDMTGQNKQIIATIDMEEVSAKKLELHSIEEAYYSGNYVYLNVGYSEGEEESMTNQQLIAVSLKNGDVIALTDALNIQSEVISCNYESLSKDIVIFSTNNTEKQELKEGGTKVYYSFSPEQQVVDTVLTTRMDYGTSHSPSMIFVGQYQGRFLVMEYDDQGSDYYWYPWNLKEREQAFHFDSNKGDLLGRLYGSVEDQVYDGNKLLAFENIADDKISVYTIDLDTGKQQKLYTETSEEFQKYIIAETTSDWVIARENGGDSYLVVSRGDFEKNGMKNARKITL